MDFAELKLIDPLLRAVHEEGYEEPTPIQVSAIPPVLAGRDVMGCAQTGTGKTAGFALPLLQRLKHKAGKKPGIRVLVLSPTRELAAQIGQSFEAYGRHLEFRHTMIFGGVKQGGQVRDLKRGVEIVVATPGRLLDLMGQGYVDLSHVEAFVLDEADRMLDMGFIDDMRRVITRLPKKRQTLLFSATLPDPIRRLGREILRDPVEVSVTPEAPAAQTVRQAVYLVENSHKQALLEHVLENPDITRVLVFIRTKRKADRVAARLKSREIPCQAIHSDRSQKEREHALKSFREGKTRVLVASDIAARGLDVDDISHVINFDMPDEPEVYIHRIGRTGRAGSSGKAVSFCGIDERAHLEAIEKLIRQPIDSVDDHPYPSPLPRKKKSREPTTPRRVNRIPVRRKNPFGRRSRKR
jgi:ATP-dependent RNA helicase RhlE